jgi:hypothetical protein
VTVKIPKSKPGNKVLYLKDRREGKFYLLWREGKRRAYHPVEGPLTPALRKMSQNGSRCGAASGLTSLCLLTMMYGFRTR